MELKNNCSNCIGTGKKNNLPCYKCAGTGTHTALCPKQDNKEHIFRIVKTSKIRLLGLPLWRCIYCNQPILSS